MIEDLQDYIFVKIEIHLITTTSRRSKTAPKKPITVITVSVFISGLCTGHLLRISRI
jgi:hypothetical protein